MALTYENKLPSTIRVAFVEKVKQVASHLGLDPNWLMIIMWKESRLNSKATNPIGAVGLIQFVPTTAKYLGYTSEQILSMSAVEQLEVVEQYFKRQPKTHNLYDTYFAVFLPILIGKPDDYVVPMPYYKGNKGLDLNANGQITVAEIKKWLTRDLPMLDYIPIVVDNTVKTVQKKNGG